jgi:hypothetical protein
VAAGAEVDGAEAGAGALVCAKTTFARHRTKKRGENFFTSKMNMNLSFCTQALIISTLTNQIKKRSDPACLDDEVSFKIEDV